MGLLPTKTQGPPFADPNAPAQAPDQEQGEAPDSEQESNVSPEEQQIYDSVVGKAADIIYGKGKVMPQIVDALKPAKDAPAQDAADPSADTSDPAKGNPAVLALANTAVQVVSKIDASAKDAGQHIPDDVLYHAGSEIVAMLAEVAEAAGFHDYSDQEINGAFIQAVDMYRPIAEASGRTDDKTLKDQFGQILQADSQGQLGQMLPGLDSGGNAPQGAPQGMPQQQPQQ
jgi:hypothetical protein